MIANLLGIPFVLGIAVLYFYLGTRVAKYFDMRLPEPEHKDVNFLFAGAIGFVLFLVTILLYMLGKPIGNVILQLLR